MYMNQLTNDRLHDLFQEGKLAKMIPQIIGVNLNGGVPPEAESKLSMFVPLFSYKTIALDGTIGEDGFAKSKHLVVTVEEGDIQQMREMLDLGPSITDVDIIKYIIVHECGHALLGHLFNFNPLLKCQKCEIKGILVDCHVDSWVAYTFDDRRAKMYKTIADARCIKLWEMLSKVTAQMLNTDFRKIDLLDVYPDCNLCKIPSSNMPSDLADAIDKLTKSRIAKEAGAASNVIDAVKTKIKNTKDLIDINGDNKAQGHGYGRDEDVMTKPMSYAELLSTLFEKKLSRKKRTILPGKKFISTMWRPDMSPIYEIKRIPLTENLPDCILVDTSGSTTSKELQVIMSKVASYINVYGLHDEDVRIFTFSGGLIEHDLNDINAGKFSVERGGTDITPALEKLAEADVIMDNFIVITDLYICDVDIKNVINTGAYIMSTNERGLMELRKQYGYDKIAYIDAEGTQ